MSADPTLDDELRDYLRAARANPVADTLRTIADNQIAHERKDLERHEEIRGSLAGHHARLSVVERLTDDLQRQEEITGQHDRRVLELAARAEGLAEARGKRVSSDPPSRRTFGQRVAAAAKAPVSLAIGKGIGIVVLLLVGWMSRHLGFVAHDARGATTVAPDAGAR